MFLNPSDARGHLRVEHGLALRPGNTRWVYIVIHLERCKGLFVVACLRTLYMQGVHTPYDGHRYYTQGNTRIEIY